jgi:hypothetical protein
MQMTPGKSRIAALVLASALAAAAPVPAAGPPSYATLARWYADAPLTIVARVRSASVVARSEGGVRLYLTGDVERLIRGAAGLAPTIAWLADVPADARGRPVTPWRGARVALGAAAVADRPGEVQLLGHGAMRVVDPATEARIAAIVTAAAAPASPPRITGIAAAFHSAGTIIGEGETQVFLTTATGAPVSLAVVRRPGEAPRWAVANGDVVDDAATVPARDTLGWYRLACSLPATLPSATTAELSDADARAARADYAFVIAQLGACVTDS